MKFGIFNYHVYPLPPSPPPPRIKNPLNGTLNGPLMVTVTKGEKAYLTVTKKTDGRYLVTTRSNSPEQLPMGPSPTFFFFCGQRAEVPTLFFFFLLLVSPCAYVSFVLLSTSRLLITCAFREFQYP